MEDTQQIDDKIISQILSPLNHDIVILMHDNPDGDAIGSAIALEEILKQLNKKVTIITQTKVDKKYSPIFGKKRVNKIYVPQDIEYDLLIILDASSPSRISIDFDNYARSTIVIDHHIYSSPYGDLYWCEDVASVGILIYRLFCKLQKSYNLSFTENLSTSIYISIKSDTLDFKTSNVTSEVFHISSVLLDNKANLSVANNMFRYPYTVLPLLKNIYDDISYDKQYRILTVTVSKMQMSYCDATYEAINGIINMVEFLDGVDVMVLLIKGGDYVSLKLRSNKINVAEIAKQFGGNGHASAAGARCFTDSSITLLNKCIKAIKRKIDNNY